MTAVAPVRWGEDRGKVAKRRRWCHAPRCRKPLETNPKQKFCTRACKQRNFQKVHRSEVLAKAAHARAIHREERRAYARAHYAANREAILAANKARAAARLVERRRDHPNCMICGKRLTDKQLLRGVTCGPLHATYRWRWFVRDKAA
jgi:hypothetical protein